MLLLLFIQMSNNPQTYFHLLWVKWQKTERFLKKEKSKTHTLDLKFRQKKVYSNNKLEYAEEKHKNKKNQVCSQTISYILVQYQGNRENISSR